MMVVRYEYHGPVLLSPSGEKTAESHLRRQISDRGAFFSMRSQSGTTAVMAMNILTEIGRPFKLESHPGVGYYVSAEAE